LAKVFLQNLRNATTLTLMHSELRNG